MVMGVSGSGKTTVGQALAQRLGWDFGEGDALHPPANVAKMASGVPLTDDDRAPWLDLVRAWIDSRQRAGHDAVITCSALRRAYRDRLRAPGVVFVLLDGPRDVLAQRLGDRRGHFMPPALLDSQLATLERPDPDEHALTVDCRLPLEAQLDAVVAGLDV